MLLLGLLSGCSEGLLEQSGEGVLPGEPSQFFLRISQVSGIATTKVSIPILMLQMERIICNVSG